ncbi:MAG: HisA/HisF-related TIM barrel protein [bacterium]|nr:HisA/HisF-related TIM barrel protein [bacterium]
METLNKNFTVIPALDIYKGGSVVRLQQGDFEKDKKTYGKSAAELVQQYLEDGALRIHTVDLAGAEGGKPVNVELFKEIGGLIRSFEQKTGKKILWQVGGGIRTEEDVERVIGQYGAQKIILGGAVIDREVESGYLSKLVGKYGAEKFIIDIAVGTSNTNPETKVLKKNGWKEDVRLSIEKALELLKKIGISQALVTSKEKDGMGQGPNLTLASYVKDCGFLVTASGGVSSVEDCAKALKCGLDSVVVGKALLDGKFTLTEANDAIKKLNK